MTRNPPPFCASCIADIVGEVHRVPWDGGTVTLCAGCAAPKATPRKRYPQAKRPEVTEVRPRGRPRLETTTAPASLYMREWRAGKRRRKPRVTQSTA